MCINNLGHMTKLAVMPTVYGKNPSKISSGSTDFSETWLEASSTTINI